MTILIKFNEGVKCPIKANDINTLEISLPILNEYPSVRKIIICNFHDIYIYLTIIL